MEQTVKQGLLSVVLPAFNEEASVPRAAATITALLAGADIPCELVFVDDGSRDATWQTIQAQAARSLENLKAILTQAGGTLDNVVKTTVFLKDLEDFVEMNRVYKTYFPENCPARSAVQVARLPKDVLVEIEAIAVL